MHSRPGHIAESPRRTTDLNAGWRFQIDTRDIGEKDRWQATAFDRSAWGPIAVPGAWDCIQDSLRGFQGVGWYSLNFASPARRPGDVARLHFGRVQLRCKVWLNGRLLGENLTYNVPFEHDVTRALRPGKNQLVLRVDNRYTPDLLPCGGVVEWVLYGGILEPVRMVVTSGLFVDDVCVRPSLSPDGATAHCLVTVANRGAARAEGILEITVKGHGTRQRARVPFTCPAGDTSLSEAVIAVRGARLWTPDSPSLYSVQAAILVDGRARDAVRDRFGFRTLAAKGRDILLNGKPVRIQGVCRYDEYGRQGPNPTVAQLRRDVRLIKAAGANCIRMHYPQSPVLLDLLDEMGLMAMEEVPICWWSKGFSKGKKRRQSLAILDHALPTLRKIVRRDKNHPCLIIYSTANESRTDSAVGAAVMKALIDEAHRLDPTRLVTFVVPQHCKPHRAYDRADLVSVNAYFGVFFGEYACHIRQLDRLVQRPTVKLLSEETRFWPDKPFLVSEYGCCSIAGLHGDVCWTEEFQVAYIRAVWQAIHSVRDVCGGILWSWADYFHRRGAPQMSAPFGPYGVVTVDRKPKAALRALAVMYGGAAARENRR